ncbi:MAG: fused MFS/spermidine synthase [Propionibacteriaceae bacterium]|nr:fused MFS/spermidine synthase [Propionibacteriaceae bacterium]
MAIIRRLLHNEDMHDIVAVPGGRNAFLVTAGTTEQSWVDLNDPLLLEFEYVQRVAEVLEAVILNRPIQQRIRIVHVGGGGLTLPRYVAARRPHSAQLVLEPDIDLIEQVRKRLPLPANSGIKVRAVDGLAGIAQMPDDYADCVIVDAFEHGCVPPDFATASFFTDVRRILHPDGIMIMNLTDKSPFGWTRRTFAGIAKTWPNLAASAETPVWKGRRFGNFVIVAAADKLPLDELERAISKAAFPHRLSWGEALKRWIGAAEPFSAQDAVSSPKFVPWQ